MDTADQLQTKETLYRLAKTLLELLFCVSSQSAFTLSIEQHLSNANLSQIIQVIELSSGGNDDCSTTIDIDPELYALLQSISMESEPQPALTYHSAEKNAIVMPS
jgi:hypothetical protein